MAQPALHGGTSGSEQPGLSTVQERAVEDLRRDGVALVRFDDLFVDPARWPELAGDIASFVEETERELPSLSRDDRIAAFGKSFLVRRFRAKKERRTVGLDDPWLRLGSSDEFLGIVTTYRNSQMRLHEFDNWYTVPDPDVPDRVASQHWHRDGWEDHIVKVFTYFNDVDQEAGPFEYIKGSAAGGKYSSLWPWQDKEVYPPPVEFEAAIDPQDIVSLTGPPGTIVFCDTSGFHRGGFARTRPRILSFHTYLSDEGQQRHKRKFNVDWPDGDSGLSAASRYALE